MNKAKKYNEDVRKALLENNVPQWKLAYKLGCNEFSFSRKMRQEMSAEDKQKIYNAIQDLSKEDGE